MTREQLGGWCQWAIVGLVLAILLYGPLAMGAVRPSEFIPAQFAAVGLLALWVLRCWLERDWRLYWPPVAWGALAFVVYAVVSYARADVEYAARQELVRVLVYFVVFFVVLNNAIHKEAPQIISLSLIAVAVGIAVWGIYQWATGANTVWGFTRPVGYAGRGSGTYICPNHCAGFLELLVPIGLAYAVGGRLNHVSKILVGYATLVMAAGIACSVSRAGWAAAGFGLLVFLLVAVWQPRFRLPALLLGLVLGCGAALLFNRSPSMQSRLGDAKISTKDNSRGIRLNAWTIAAKLWQTSPWTGVGPGHYDVRYREFRPELLQARPQYAHNDYLNTLADWGVIGLALVLVTVGLAGWSAARSWKHIQRQGLELVAKRGERSAQHSNRAAFVMGAAAGLSALLVHSLLDFNMQVPANALIVVTLLALLAGHLRYATEAHWVRGGVFTKLIFSFVMVALAVAGVAEGRRHWREYGWLRRAESAQAREDFPGRGAALKAAFAVEPKNFETAYNLGEMYRLESWQGGDNYAEHAVKAMEWFHRAIELNPYDAYSPMRIGMCYHWLGKHQEAGPWFEKARKLDPNGYYLIAHLGWHKMQLEDYDAARNLFLRSLQITPYLAPNTISHTYLAIIESRRLQQPFPTPPKPAPKP